MPDSNTSPSARNEFDNRLGWGMSANAVMFGAAIIGCHIESGPRRWSAAAWQFALQVPGSPATWGVVILIAGLAMLYGKLFHRRRPYHYGTLAASIWFVILCGASLLAFWDYNSVNPLSPIAWGAFAFVYSLLCKKTTKKAAN